MTLYSWTGHSRTPTVEKIQFNKLKKTLELFLDVIRYADISFSHTLLEQFFKDGVLKHSKDRSKQNDKTAAKRNRKNNNSSNNTNTLSDAAIVTATVDHDESALFDKQIEELAETLLVYDEQ